MQYYQDIILKQNDKILLTSGDNQQFYHRTYRFAFLPGKTHFSKTHTNTLYSKSIKQEI